MIAYEEMDPSARLREAREAVLAARKEARVSQRGVPEVERIVSSLRRIKEDNHFASRIEESMRLAREEQ